MRVWDWVKTKHDLSIAVTERERKAAARSRLNLLNHHEKALKNQAEKLRKEFDRELNEKLNRKDSEIQELKKMIRYLKSSYENLQILSGEFELELRGAAMLVGKLQNRFANIEDRAFRETKKIEKKIDKFIKQDG